MLSQSQCNWSWKELKREGRKEKGKFSALNELRKGGNEFFQRWTQKY